MGCGPSKTQRVINSSSFQDDDDANKVEKEELSETESNYDNQVLKLSGKVKPSNKIPKISSGPMLAQLQRTPSQVEFFEKLDEKINKGPDLSHNRQTPVASEDNMDFLEEVDEDVEKAVVIS